MISKHIITAAIPLGHYEDQPTTLVREDGFEGGAGDWYVGGDLDLTTATPRTGTYCLEYVTPSANAGGVGLLSLKGLSVGHTYTITTWVRGHGGVTYAGISTWVYGADAVGVFPLTTEYQRIDFEFVAESESQNLVMVYSAGGGVIRMDDFTMTHTPPPVWIDTSVPLVVADAEATLDESWSPYAQARLTCAVPPLASLDDIDPRLGRRIRIRLRQTFGESEPLSALSAAWAGTTLATQTAALADTFLTGLSATYGQPYNAQGVRASTRRTLDLVLRSREVDHVNGTMYLTAASDEALLQDFGLVATTATSAGTTSVRAICAWVLAKVGLILYPGSADGTVTDSTWLPGQSAWDYLRPLVDAVGLRLWCDEHRNFRLTEPIDGTSGGLSISAKYATQATDAIDLDRDWYDAVVITYQWRDAAGNDLTAYDTAFAPGYSKVLALTYDRPYPGPGAAAAMLRRTLGRGRVQALAAVSDYGATPGMALTVTLPSTPIQTGLLSAVTWQVPGDEMRLTPRDLIDTPISAWVYARAGVAWNEIPVGTDWTEYVYEPAGV